MTVAAQSILRKAAVLGLPWVLAACPVCGGGDPIPIQSGTYDRDGTRVTERWEIA